MPQAGPVVIQTFLLSDTATQAIMPEGGCALCAVVRAAQGFLYPPCPALGCLTIDRCRQRPP